MHSVRRFPELLLALFDLGSALIMKNYSIMDEAFVKTSPTQHQSAHVYGAAMDGTTKGYLGSDEGQGREPLPGVSSVCVLKLTGLQQAQKSCLPVRSGISYLPPTEQK